MSALPPSIPTHAAAKGRWRPPTWLTSRVVRDDRWHGLACLDGPPPKLFSGALAVAYVRPIPTLQGVPSFKGPHRGLWLISKSRTMTCRQACAHSAQREYQWQNSLMFYSCPKAHAGAMSHF
ncbi:hypothetical protein AAEP93_004152 [Penicillium crustosum]